MDITPTSSKINDNSAERIEREDGLPRLGQWYWVKAKHTHIGEDDEPGTKIGDDFEWIGCVMAIGSNYVKIEGPRADGAPYSSVRIHIDQFEARARRELNPDIYIQSRVGHYQTQVNGLLREVNRVTQGLGLQDSSSIAGPAAGESKAVATLSGQQDVKAYEKALVLAREQTLPDLFKQIEKSNRELARWMTAQTLPLRAQIEPLRSNLDRIEDQIFSISLYAGVVEEAVQCCGGEVAPAAERLTIMQRMAYMDEECLAAYTAGGMDFQDIEQFDEWISAPTNRDRILPYPRTMIAMRVRRHEKDREVISNRDAHIAFNMARADKMTYLYLRNGEQVWRISTEIDFGEELFPARGSLDPTEPQMLKTFGDSFDKFMSRREFDHLNELYEAAKLKAAQWKADNPGQSWVSNPYGGGVGDYRDKNIPYDFRPQDWKPLDFSNVHYDEAMDHVAKEIKQYNRIALIIQGLFDRSPVLQPHKPVRSWTSEGFAEAIELIYDGSDTLYDGDMPDFEAYRAELNASLGVGSVVTGQDDYWSRVEATRENRKIDDNHRIRDKRYWTRYRPSGNPGPGLVGVITDWKPKKRVAVFTWWRDKAWDIGTTQATLTVPADELLNISAYKPGDYKRFFRDPRSRAAYKHWAPLMLAAEDYHAGKLKLGDQKRIDAARAAGFPVRE